MRDTAAHENIKLFVELYSTKGFGKGIANIVCGCNLLENQVVVVDPVLDDEMFDVDVAGSPGGL